MDEDQDPGVQTPATPLTYFVTASQPIPRWLQVFGWIMVGYGATIMLEDGFALLDRIADGLPATSSTSTVIDKVSAIISWGLAAMLIVGGALAGRGRISGVSTLETWAWARIVTTILFMFVQAARWGDTFHSALTKFYLLSEMAAMLSRCAIPLIVMLLVNRQLGNEEGKISAKP